MSLDTDDPDVIAALNAATLQQRHDRDEHAKLSRLVKEMEDRMLGRRLGQQLVGPEIVETEIVGFAHCPMPPIRSANCSLASKQVRIRLIREEIIESYGSRGGSTGDPRDHLPENSRVNLRCVDHADAACPECGRHRELAEQQRPSYEYLSGRPQDGLIRVRDGLEPNFQPGLAAQLDSNDRDRRVSDLEAQVAALTAAAPAPASRVRAEDHRSARTDGVPVSWDVHADPAIGQPTALVNKASIGGRGVYAKVDVNGNLRGYGARRQRVGEKGKMDDARQTFESIEAAQAWRAEVDGA